MAKSHPTRQQTPPGKLLYPATTRITRKCGPCPYTAWAKILNQLAGRFEERFLA